MNFSTLNILIVDDEVFARSIITKVLQSLGVQEDHQRYRNAGDGWL